MEHADQFETEQMQAMAYSLRVGAKGAVMEAHRLLILNNEWTAAQMLLDDIDSIVNQVLVPFESWAVIQRAKGVKL